MGWPFSCGFSPSSTDSVRSLPSRSTVISIVSPGVFARTASWTSCGVSTFSPATAVIWSCGCRNPSEALSSITSCTTTVVGRCR